jgi:hypothetical protein
MEMARSLGTDVVTALRRGFAEGRSGEILLVPEPWNVLGQWPGGLRRDDPRTTHSSPWTYHQQVPLALYGPGFVREGVVVDRPTTVADVAPTLAALLDVGFEAEGSALEEVLVPGRRRPPRAIVVVAVDGGGWNVLEQWPDAWPVQRRLMREGTTYTNAVVGSAPSVTAPVHATIGTGVFPETHGIVENTGRLPDGTIGEIAHHEARLDLLQAPTLADEWDRSRDNAPWVGMIGFESWHLPMIGPGALVAGNDRDVAVLWHREERRFWINERFYTLPPLPPPEQLDRRVRELDATDGSLDGRWDGEDLDPELPSFTATPAYAAYHGDAVLQVMEESELGSDEVTDLLFVEMKTADITGHVWNMVSPQSEAVLREQDRVLEDIVAVLDRRVGRGRYVVALTADHGQTPQPDVVSGLRIDRGELFDDLNAAFDGVVAAVHPTDLYLDLGAPEIGSVSVEDMARFIGGYRYGDGLPEGTDTERIDPELLDRRVFAAALPGEWLASLTPEEVEALGSGDYPEGDLTSPPRLAAFP